jgi:hypothetical protein
MATCEGKLSITEAKLAQRERELKELRATVNQLKRDACGEPPSKRAVHP